MELRIENLDLFQNKKQILKNMSLTAKAGQVTGIIGPNGCGKSSLLRCIYGAVLPGNGRVLLNGQESHRFTRRALARNLAVVLQSQTSDLGLTVLETVLLGRIPHKPTFGGNRKEDLALARESLARTGITHLEDRAFSTLSGGEKQRALIARSLSQTPKILLMDEPTNHLDILQQYEILELVKSLGITVLLVLHDLNLAATFCEKIYAMQNGQLIARGTPETLLTNKLIQALYGIDSLVDQHPARGHPRITFNHPRFNHTERTVYEVH
ncbi:ABC transporter ATP-binding protein [Kiloniella laminariae]|uniref:ABC transporter ATP-binding protein n=1 Tax=Kiloniella laminariae TaxID=454162 RepID=UPI00037135A4|nr:ABC transporter ATP-binding protein [Kiloniella laminariae]